MWWFENYEGRAALAFKVKNKIFEKKSRFQEVKILDTEYWGKLLVLDDIVMLSERDEFIYHEMIVHPALTTHPNPERVLVVGGGDGGAIREVLKHSSVKEAVLCEIDEVVVEACKEHFPGTAGMLDDPRVKVVHEDGFKFLKDYENYFDVIITDSSDPIGPGVSLFREDYYRLVKAALRDGGIMVAQSESPWYYEDILADMTKAMCNVFEKVESYIAMVPLYPTGFWMLTAASDRYSLKDFDEDRSREISETCRYYSPEIHRSALNLPRFAKEIVNNK